MKLGRNQRCPCGSGNKYKICCLLLDRQRAAVAEVTRPARLIARGVEVWLADYIALPILIDDAPAARSAARLIVIDGAPIGSEILQQPPFEPAEAAQDLAESILALATQLASRPRAVRVRRTDLAQPLRAALADSGISVTHHQTLPALCAVEADLLERYGGGRRPEPLSVLAWSAWRQGEAWTASLFTAAAAFYRAEPWDALGDSDFLLVETDQGMSWSTCVLGHAEEARGISIAKDTDAFSSFAEADRDDPWSAVSSDSYSLLFGDAPELPPSLHKEVASADWEVASPDAYPSLFTFNTLAGGITQSDARDLLLLLAVIPRFLAKRRPPGAPWIDPGTGFSVTVVSGAFENGVLEVADALEPGDAQGGGAEPGAELAFPFDDSLDDDTVLDEEWAIVEPFASTLTHCDQASRDRCRDTALLFISFLVGCARVPVRAVHEYDLRVFLYDWLPRQLDCPEREALATLSSLRSLFVFLGAEMAIRCPWAAAILDDAERFRTRWRTLPRDPGTEDDIDDWRFTHELTLSPRLLMPRQELGEDDAWLELLGPKERGLRNALVRRWLGWRDELLRAGLDPPSSLLPELAQRQREWEGTPQARLGGRSPLATVLDERTHSPALPEIVWPDDGSDGSQAG